MSVRDCRKEAVILAIASGSTVSEASKSTRVAERTIRFWLGKPKIRDRVAEVRAELFGKVVGKLSNLGLRAADTLEKLLDSTSEHVRLKAASAILSNASRFHATLVPMRVQVETPGPNIDPVRMKTCSPDEWTEEELEWVLSHTDEKTLLEEIRRLEKKQVEAEKRAADEAQRRTAESANQEDNEGD